MKTLPLENTDVYPSEFIRKTLPLALEKYISQ